MIPEDMETRKRRFRAALALTGQTAAQWAEANDLTASYLSSVLAEKAISKRLCEKIDEFTNQHLVSTNALVA